MPIAPNGCTRCDGFGGTGWEPCPECLGGEDIDDDDIEQAAVNDLRADGDLDPDGPTDADREAEADTLWHLRYAWV